MVSEIHITRDYRQSCHLGNTSEHCRLGLFQDSEFSGDLEVSDLKVDSLPLLPCVLLGGVKLAACASHVRESPIPVAMTRK